MRHLKFPILFLLLFFSLALVAGCQTYEAARPTDVDPFLSGVATRGPIEPADYPWVPPTVRYVPMSELGAIRELDAGNALAWSRPRPGPEAANYAGDEWEDGVYYEDEFYPGAVFVEGDYEEFAFEDDGYYVDGGVILGASHVHHHGCGHHGYGCDDHPCREHGNHDCDREDGPRPRPYRGHGGRIADRTVPADVAPDRPRTSARTGPRSSGHSDDPPPQREGRAQVGRSTEERRPRSSPSGRGRARAGPAASSPNRRTPTRAPRERVKREVDRTPQREPQTEPRRAPAPPPKTEGPRRAPR